ncbi:hypothetical protein MKK63_25870 [Methylobacterium sp. J-088]|uniref:hypothetical protein n=1 Tax=Methylobacterium sp. J-088 TaxID=2836664 RepID=UPI001FB8BCF5|nr:hypothetical protein [Methylobacterium sp. J-088]MCJ2066103.1 hypothetical protein [Methylobacterium sp. J-088]
MKRQQYFLVVFELPLQSERVAWRTIDGVPGVKVEWFPISPVSGGEIQKQAFNPSERPTALRQELTFDVCREADVASEGGA